MNTLTTKSLVSADINEELVSQVDIGTILHVYVTCSECGDKLDHEITVDSNGSIEICVDPCIIYNHHA